MHASPSKCNPRNTPPENLTELEQQLEQLQRIQLQELESCQKQEREQERISIINNQKSPDTMRRELLREQLRSQRGG
jgi:hypothetical protein